jgi:membrane protein DedA with SNARE-associated domain
VTLALSIFSGHTLDHLLHSYGYAAVFAFVAIESLGVPFPGESMVIAAALYAGLTHHLAVLWIFACAALGAIVGDNIGFAIGWYLGFALLRRFGPRVRINEGKLKVGKLIFDRYGGRVVFFGRFVSILRTYAAFLAGTTRMSYRRFLLFNAAGGILWSALYAFGFYYAGAALKKASGPFNIAAGSIAALAVIGFIFWLRGHERRLEAEAQEVYPGPLAGHLRG